jgi:adenine-specific DNA-methyltransferase
MIETLVQPARRKAFGAYYTPATAADFLARWAIRAPDDRIIDPSSGGGVFLRAASQRLIQIGGDAAARIWGVELDETAHRYVLNIVARDLGLDPRKLLRGNFFDIAGAFDLKFNAVIGNPPYIRYQAFAGVDRSAAKQELSRGRVELSDLASAWAPFVVRSIDLLAEGGRLAMVLPMELFHAGYAKRVLAHLGTSFSNITLVTFDRQLFPDLSQETLLLLADDRRNVTAELRVKTLSGVEDLARLASGSSAIRGAKRIPGDVLEGRSRLLSHLLPPKARTLYEEFRRHHSVVSLASLADVGIGYVTGCNDFFHLSPGDIARTGLPADVVRRAVFRGRAFVGTEFDERHWEIATGQGDAGYLLAIAPALRPSRGLARLIAHGEEIGVQHAYKCRVRNPWYSVPHVHVADAFLTYMSGVRPRLVVNGCGAVAPNTLHLVRMYPLAACGVWNLALSWRSSLTQLSVEVEGHAMGGGMLKLEPGEATSVLIANPALDEQTARHTCELIDGLETTINATVATDMVDRKVLREVLGFSLSDCRLLQEAVVWLRDRRYRRTKKKGE